MLKELIDLGKVPQEWFGNKCPRCYDPSIVIEGRYYRCYSCGEWFPGIPSYGYIGPNEDELDLRSLWTLAKTIGSVRVDDLNKGVMCRLGTDGIDILWTSQTVEGALKGCLDEYIRTR